MLFSWQRKYSCIFQVPQVLRCVPQRRLYFIFRDLTPSSSEALFLSSVLQFSVVCEAIINHISPVFSVRGLGRWLLCGLWGKLEGGKALWTKNVWRCLVWGGMHLQYVDASCTDPYAKARKKKPSGWSCWPCRLKYHRKPGRSCRPASRSLCHFCRTGILQTCRIQLKAKVWSFSSLMCPCSIFP